MTLEGHVDLVGSTLVLVDQKAVLADSGMSETTLVVAAGLGGSLLEDRHDQTSQDLMWWQLWSRRGPRWVQRLAHRTIGLHHSAASR